MGRGQETKPTGKAFIARTTAGYWEEELGTGFHREDASLFIHLPGEIMLWLCTQCRGMFHIGHIGDRSNQVESNKMSTLIHCHDWSCADSIVGTEVRLRNRVCLYTKNIPTVEVILQFDAP